ncbi:MAG: hypothetical protein ACK44H_00670 [Candidatus Kryptonium sp.]
MKIPKQIERVCDYCGDKQKFKFRGNFEAEPDSKFWYACQRCKHVTLISVEELNLQADTNSQGNYRIYSASETYEVGETIYHTEWQDYGKVKKKEISSSGYSIIIVEFEKLGPKKLVENFKQ